MAWGCPPEGLYGATSLNLSIFTTLIHLKINVCSYYITKIKKNLIYFLKKKTIIYCCGSNCGFGVGIFYAKKFMFTKRFFYATISLNSVNLSILGYIAWE